jgi:hypothetical protein
MRGAVMADDPKDHPAHVRIVDIQDLGIPPAPGVNLPTVTYILDDDDAGECRYTSKDEIRPFYVDDPIHVTPVQPDVWTLDIDNQEVTFTYSTGAQYTVLLGSIDMNPGPGASRFRKSGNIVFPTDEGGQILLNATTTPRLAGLRIYLHEQTLRISEERLKMAEIVYAFTQIMHLYGSYFDAAGSLQ